MLKANLTLLGLASEPVTRRLANFVARFNVRQPLLIRYRPVLECLLQLHRLVTKKKKMIFWFFYVLNFFCIFIFYRMCAERAQEHTRTHTALTAGVEGEGAFGKLCLYISGRVTKMDQSSSSIGEKTSTKGR